MKCCALPTISTAASANDRALVAGQMNALLFAQVLKPLAKALGPFGDAAVESVAETMFVRRTR